MAPAIWEGPVIMLLERCALYPYDLLAVSNLALGSGSA